MNIAPNLVYSRIPARFYGSPLYEIEPLWSLLAKKLVDLGGDSNGQGFSTAGPSQKGFYWVGIHRCLRSNIMLSMVLIYPAWITG